MPFYLRWILKKGQRFWTILQMKSCLSIKNASYIQKLESVFDFQYKVVIGQCAYGFVLTDVFFTSVINIAQVNH